MRRALSLFGLLLAPLALACATLTVGSDWDRDVDFSRLHSFGILESQPHERGEGDPRLSELTDRHTERAIDDLLTARGYTLVTDGPADFFVVYTNDIREEQHLVAYRYGLGSEWHYFPGYGWGGYGRGWDDPYVAVEERTFTPGTLVIDILDAATNRLIWRGWAEGTLTESTDMESRIREAAGEILARFPPTQGG